jgi:hypothetical protein
MSSRIGDESGFERRARAVLRESVGHIDARTRSRLNRARQAALHAASAPRRFRPTLGVMPIAGVAAAAALAVALTLFTRGTFHSVPNGAAGQPSVEVLDMLADDDGIAFMENYDHSFYEWAAAQQETAGGDAGGAAAGAASGAGGAGSGTSG